MVKTREKSHLEEDGSVKLELWLEHLSSKLPETNLQIIRNACQLSQLAGGDKPTETGESCLQQGLAIADILADLDLDPITIAAAIVYESVQYSDLSLEDIREHLNDKVAKLVDGVQRMNSIRLLHRHSQEGSTRFQTSQDNIRKMLIAMVDNIQVVLIKLAERIRILRRANRLPVQQQKELARETMDIYAPLANRLGIGQIKWELEDLAFRYLEPEKYKEIAKGLNARRIDRDKFVNEIVTTLQETIEKAGIKNFKVYGRSKHIYSIYKKMQRKNVDVQKIYDATAVRVLVDTVEDCYTVLGIVHQLWQRIPEEFDDYIIKPKSNGYRSLHTAVLANDKHFEVQIRTYEMHEQAELGVAAHWIYKEGGLQPEAGHERKLAWLKQVLDWQKEVTHTNEIPNPILPHQHADELEDRVYVFTPAGDIVDLPKGSTPLDFAYHIHSEIGHRCRGAKIDGNIVPLTHKLKTGEQVSILTAKEAKPSRDWVNPELGYLHTTKAKAKVLSWFKQLDYEKHRHDGQIMLEKELRRHDIPIHQINFEKLAHQLQFKHHHDLYAALARNDIKLNQVLSLIPTNQQVETVEEPQPILGKPVKTKKRSQDFIVQNLENVLAKPANCCKPIPGDEIIGYITQGQGVSVHRKSCTNILKIDAHRKSRLVTVNWGLAPKTDYAVDIAIVAHDKQGLTRDISTIIATEKINLLAMKVRTSAAQQRAYITMTFEINHLDTLQRVIHKLQLVPTVIEVKRIR